MMSVKVQAEIWQFSKQKGTALLLMLAIGDFADDDGMAFPSIKRLAIKTRISERTVQRLLAGIQATGELVIDRGQGPKGCHLFRVTICRGDIQGQKGVTSRDKIVKEKESIKEKEKNAGTINEPSSSSGPSATERRKDPAYEIFSSYYRQTLDAPYVRKSGDFVQLANLRKACAVGSIEPPPHWANATKNYFGSDLGTWTLADLCTRYGTFRNGSVDRFGKLIKQELSIEERAQLGEEHWKTVKANR